MATRSRTRSSQAPAAAGQAARIRSRRPLTDEVHEAIRDGWILNGAVAPGERLPSESELSDRYGVSRITVRAALRSLQEAGYITIRHGQGSTVLPGLDAITSGIAQLCSFETFAAEQGRAVTSTDLELEQIQLSTVDAARFDLRSGSPALIIRRTKVYGGTKVGWIVDYVPEAALPASVLSAEYAGSVLDVLLAHGDLQVDHADCELRPVALGAKLARRLDVRPGTAALLFDELTRTSSGQAVNWSQAWLLPDHFRFVVRRRA